MQSPHRIIANSIQNNVNIYIPYKTPKGNDFEGYDHRFLQTSNEITSRLIDIVDTGPSKNNTDYENQTIHEIRRFHELFRLSVLLEQIRDDRISLETRAEIAKTEVLAHEHNSMKYNIRNGGLVDDFTTNI